MLKNAAGTLQIDDLRLDLAARRVLRDEEEIELGRLTFDLFAALARAAPAALSTDDLVAQVWKAEAVSDETVQQRVSLLRRALGQDSGRDYVETVRGFGYRLAVEPRRIERASPAEGRAKPAVPPANEFRPRARWPRLALVALGILALLMILSVLAVMLRQAKRWTPGSFSLVLAEPSVSERRDCLREAPPGMELADPGRAPEPRRASRFTPALSSASKT